MKENEEQIREVIVLQKQVEENKKEVSRILSEVMKNNKLITYGARIVFEGELWEVTRWPHSGVAKKGNIGTWRLSSKGKIFLC